VWPTPDASNGNVKFAQGICRVVHAHVLLKQATGRFRNGKPCDGELGKTLVRTESAQKMLHMVAVKSVVVKLQRFDGLGGAQQTTQAMDVELCFLMRHATQPQCSQVRVTTQTHQNNFC
jgi:hypothetical protein